MDRPLVPSEPRPAKKPSSKDRSGSASSQEDRPAEKQKKEKPESAPGVQGRWHKSEHDRFIEAIKKFGKDWKSVEQYIETRSGSQIRSHAQKFFNRIIKKYGVDKTEVINFIQLEYKSADSSASATPQKKKKPEREEGQALPGLQPRPTPPALSRPPEQKREKEPGSLPHKRLSVGPGEAASKEGGEGSPSESYDVSIKSQAEERPLEPRPNKSVFRRVDSPSLVQSREHRAGPGPELLGGAGQRE